MILFEPFKIKVVEELPVSTEEDRAVWIRQAGYNVFALRAEQVTIDLLTDSGTGAMSDAQWAAMMQGDESYAGSRSFLELERTVQELTGIGYIIPVHQGRAAEHLLFSSLLEPGDYVVSNGLFDTTGANIRACGAEGLDLPCAEAEDPFLIAPFKGNVDLQKLEAALLAHADKIRCIVMTITNNSHGGQPVSLENLRSVRKLANRYRKLIVLDACRFAENSCFIKKREPECAALSIRDIARACFDTADIVTFSGKKDALANIGGLLCVRERELVQQLKNRMVVTEGFPTYGGLAGYSLAAMNRGLQEVLDERYLRYRLRTVEWAVERLAAAHVPVLRPAGGHAIYIDASRFYSQVPRHEYPGLVLTSELFQRAGIRGCELGGVAFGRKNAAGAEELPKLDLVRLALPRRTYTEAHIGYVVETLIGLFAERELHTRGFAFDHEAPVLRHFNSTFRRLE